MSPSASGTLVCRCRLITLCCLLLPAKPGAEGVARAPARTMLTHYNAFCPSRSVVNDNWVINLLLSSPYSFFFFCYCFCFWFSYAGNETRPRPPAPPKGQWSHYILSYTRLRNTIKPCADPSSLTACLAGWLAVINFFANYESLIAVWILLSAPHATFFTRRGFLRSFCLSLLPSSHCLSYLLLFLI